MQVKANYEEVIEYEDFTSKVTFKENYVTGNLEKIGGVR